MSIDVPPAIVSPACYYGDRTGTYAETAFTSCAYYSAVDWSTFRPTPYYVREERIRRSVWWIKYLDRIVPPKRLRVSLRRCAGERLRAPRLRVTPFFGGRGRKPLPSTRAHRRAVAKLMRA